jgi:hypothetical protein
VTSHSAGAGNQSPHPFPRRVEKAPAAVHPSTGELDFNSGFGVVQEMWKRMR